jgi:salicylate hydroxylase
MFAALGITEAVMREATIPSNILMLDALSGEEVTHIPTGANFRARFTHPYIIIHREDIHRVLIDACAAVPNIAMEGGAGVAGFAETDGGVEVALEDGRKVEGAALIGADGLRSAVRAGLVSEGEPVPIGYVAHRTIVPMHELPAHIPYREEVVLWGGPGFHIVHYPLRHGTLFNIVAVFRRSGHDERGDAAAYRAELERAYRNAHPSMKALLAMLDLNRRQAVGDRDPVRHWHKGRVVLLGDAAHPTLQSLAQGACMAIEDGVCLAEYMHACGGDFAAAFQRFERARGLRTARVTMESRAIWDAYHAEGIARDVYWQMLSERSEADVFQCLAWLYDGFHFPEESAPHVAHG